MKLSKIIIAILGGVDVVMTMITPILLVLLCVNVFNLNDFGENVLLIMASLSCIFRAYKIGFMK